MKPITILLAEDHTIVREGFRKMLELDGQLVVVGEAKDGRQAIAMANELLPDVVLMDIAMPRLNGLQATRQMVATRPGIRILILTAHNDEVYLRNAIECGAVGFILKQTSAYDVCGAIRRVHRGESYFPQSVTKWVAPPGAALARKNIHLKKMALLTSREMEVLQLVAEGKANKETAAELDISIKTVEKHRANLMEKLDIHHTAGLTRYAIAAGIIESSVQVTIL